MRGSRGHTFSPARIAEIRALEEQCKGWPDGAHDAFMVENGVSLDELFDYWEVTGQVEEAPMLDHERVAEILAREFNGCSYASIEELATILEREYGDVRREALEAAENACLEEAQGQGQKASFGLEDDAKTAAMNCAAAIRKLKEET